MPDRVIDALQLKPGQSVADVVAGTGYFSTRLAKSAPAPKVFAVDIEPSMVAHLTGRAKGERLANMTAVLAGAEVAVSIASG
jgi:ubiquinone/menaquinone biosynthesis C-methylase UbiE